MKSKLRCIFFLVVLAMCLTGPLGAQLEEAVRVPWPGFQVLKGRWQARDSNDIIEIQNIDPTGRMEVNYFKSEPVNVAKAQAARDGKATRVLLDLRDPGSPGCIYDLTYDPGSDRLRGRYWLKGSPKGIEVVYSRIK
jgi:hypothetical protein